VKLKLHCLLQIVSLEKLKKYFEIFQCSVPTFLLLLGLNVCEQCILSDTVDNFTLLSMPSHGDLCDFLQKINEKPNSALNVDRVQKL